MALGVAVVALGSDEDGQDATATTTTPTAPPSATVPWSTAAPTTDAPTSTGTSVPALRTFTIAATGDFLVHTSVSSQALTYGGGSNYDFSPMLADVTPILSAADLAICHVEIPLSADDRDLSGYPVFSAPHELAPAIA